MKKWLKLVVAVGFVPIAVATPSAVEAGTGPPIGQLQVGIVVEGVGSGAIAAGLSVEIQTPGGQPVATDAWGCSELPNQTPPGVSIAGLVCSTVPAGTYSVVVNGAPDGYTVDRCGANSDGEVIVPEGGNASCFNSVFNPGVVRLEFQTSSVEPGVFDGLTPELYAFDGSFTQVPSPECISEDLSFDPFPQTIRLYECAVAPGQYAVGVSGLLDGFVADVGFCSSQVNIERLPGGDGDGVHFTKADGEISRCSISVFDPNSALVSVFSFSPVPGVLDNITVEAFPDIGEGVGADVWDPNSTACVRDNLEEYSPPSGFYVECELPPLANGPQTYYLGVSGVPDGYFVEEASCFQPVGPVEQLDPDVSFVQTGFGQSRCQVVIAPEGALVVQVLSSSLDTSLLEGLDVEAFLDQEGTPGANAIDPATCITSDIGIGPGFTTTVAIQCPLDPTEPTDYLLGIDNLATDAADVDGFCFGDRFNELIGTGNVGFTQIPGGFQACSVLIVDDPDVFIDVVVEGSDHTTDEIVEIFATGEGGGLVDTVGDPDPALCDPSNVSGFQFGGPTAIIDANPMPECGLSNQAPGDYVLGLDPAYEATAVECTPFFSFSGFASEQIGGGLGDFTHGAFVGEGGSQATHCIVTVALRTQTVRADVVVTNDDGGVSDGSDMTIEVFDTEGALVDSGVDPAPNDDSAGAEFELPLGDYSFGVSGPDGYDYSVVITPVTVTEIFPDGAGDFGVTAGGTVTAVVSADDQATTTTVVETTTTIMVTTTIDGGVVAPTVAPTLPPTGSSGTNSGLALAALMLLLLGAGAVQLARRP